MAWHTLTPWAVQQHDSDGTEVIRCYSGTVPASTTWTRLLTNEVSPLRVGTTTLRPVLYCAPVSGRRYKTAKKHTRAKPARGSRRQWILWAMLPATLLIAVIIVLARRGPAEEDEIAEFDGARADRLVKELCKRGHRYYGAPKRAEAIANLQTMLDEVTDQTALQRFDAHETSSDEDYELTNIIGRLDPQATRRVILASHWDTRKWAEEDADPEQRDDPIEGANDGTSGVAVLLELARVLKTRPPSSVGVDFVLFDGEEFGRPGSDDYCQGSRYFARMLKGLYPRSRPEYAIVIDMVGDCDQGFLPELTSLKRAPRLVGKIWNAATRLGYGEIFSSSGNWAIEDDHTALQKAGIQSALLIDYDYPHWHTQGDTVDKVCATSLERVGKVLLEVLLNPVEERDNG